MSVPENEISPMLNAIPPAVAYSPCTADAHITSRDTEECPVVTGKVRIAHRCWGCKKCHITVEECTRCLASSLVADFGMGTNFVQKFMKRTLGRLNHVGRLLLAFHLAEKYPKSRVWFCTSFEQRLKKYRKDNYQERLPHLAIGTDVFSDAGGRGGMHDQMSQNGMRVSTVAEIHWPEMYGQTAINKPDAEIAMFFVINDTDIFVTPYVSEETYKKYDPPPEPETETEPKSSEQ